MKKRLVAITLVAMMLLVIGISSASALSVTGGRLNMRKSPSKSATIILYLPNGTPVDPLYEYSGEWQRIGSWGYLSGEEPGYHHYKQGWVMSQYLN